MKQFLVGPTPKQVIALTVTLLSEGQFRLAGCLLRKQADTITVEQHWPELTDIQALRTLSTDANLPVVLVLEGRGILHKEFAVSVALPTSDADVLTSVLPGSTAADFYLQRTTGANQHYITLIRQDTVKSLLIAFREYNYYVIAVEAGPFSLQSLVPFLEPKWQEITARVGHYLVTLHAGRVAQFASIPLGEGTLEQYKIGEQELTSQTLPAYAAGVRMLMGNENSLLAAELVGGERSEWQQKLLFRQRGIGLLGLFLGILLINFLFFSHLSSENQALTASTTSSRQELKTLAALRQKLQQQQQFLQLAGWLTPTNQSIYADQLAATVPSGLQLTLLELNPSDEAATRQQQEAVFIQNTIIVKGKCREAQTLNNWLQTLSHLPWIKQIQHQNFTYDYGVGVGTFSFTIQLPVVP